MHPGIDGHQKLMSAQDQTDMQVPTGTQNTSWRHWSPSS